MFTNEAYNHVYSINLYWFLGMLTKEKAHNKLESFPPIPFQPGLSYAYSSTLITKGYLFSI